MTRTDTAEAVVGGPIQAVFGALVDVGARTTWLPPTGMSGRFSWFDPRPGGGYRLELTYDDPAVQGKSEANTDVVEVRFVVVEAPRLLVEEAKFVADDPGLAGPMTMTWSLEEADEGTLVTITATGVPEGISSEDHAAGFRSTLANLADYVEGATAGG